jgi:hypothetical protein
MGPEQTIQRAILEYLNWKHIYCWKNNTAGIYVKARNTYIPSHAPGVSDILACLKVEGIGVMLCLEVKVPKGRQSDVQKRFEMNVKEAGGFYYIVTSIEDVQSAIDHVTAAVKDVIKKAA